VARGVNEMEGRVAVDGRVLGRVWGPSGWCPRLPPVDPWAPGGVSRGRGGRSRKALRCATPALNTQRSKTDSNPWEGEHTPFVFVPAPAYQ